MRRGLFVDYLDIVGPFNPSPAPPESYRKIFICSQTTTQCARTIISHLLERAYRRPITDAELASKLQLFTLAQKQGDKFPELRGVYVYGDYQYGKMWGLRYDYEAKKAGGKILMPKADVMGQGWFAIFEDPSGTLTFASGSWTSATTYVVVYDVIDINSRLANVDVRVTGAQDEATETPQAAATVANAMIGMAKRKGNSFRLCGVCLTTCRAP